MRKTKRLVARGRRRISAVTGGKLRSYVGHDGSSAKAQVTSGSVTAVPLGTARTISLIF